MKKTIIEHHGEVFTELTDLSPVLFNPVEKPPQLRSLSTANLYSERLIQLRSFLTQQFIDLSAFELLNDPFILNLYTEQYHLHEYFDQTIYSIFEQLSVFFMDTGNPLLIERLIDIRSAFDFLLQALPQKKQISLYFNQSDYAIISKEMSLFDLYRFDINNLSAVLLASGSLTSHLSQYLYSKKIPLIINIDLIDIEINKLNIRKHSIEILN